MEWVYIYFTSKTGGVRTAALPRDMVAPWLDAAITKWGYPLDNGIMFRPF